MQRYGGMEQDSAPILQRKDAMLHGHPLVPTLTLLTAVCAGWAADGSDIQFHGFVSEGYLLTKNDALFTPDSRDSGTLQFNEFGINAMATPVNRLRVGIQIAAQDLGDDFKDKPEIDWAYGNYTLPTVAKFVDLDVTAGRFKIGQGLYNDYRDLDMTRSSVFLPMAVYNPRWRELILATNGVSAHAAIHAGPLGSFDVSAYIGSQSYDSTQGALHDIALDAGMDASIISVKAVEGGNIVWNTPIDGLRFKYSLLDGRGVKFQGTYVGNQPGVVVGSPYSLTAPHYWDNIFSIEYQRDKLTIAAEYDYNYIKTTVSGTAALPTPPFPAGSTAPFSQISSDTTNATYISVAYRILPALEAVGGWQWNETLTALTGNAKWYAWNAAMRYDVMEHWLVKAEYQWAHGIGPLRLAEQPDGQLHQTWGYLAVKTTFDF